MAYKSFAGRILLCDIAACGAIFYRVNLTLQDFVTESKKEGWKTHKGRHVCSDHDHPENKGD